MIKYVIFDVDGTMIDTEKAINYAYQSIIFKKYGRYFTEEELLKGYGVPTAVSLERYGFTDIESVLKEYYGYLMEGFTKCNTFEGIPEILNNLKELNVPLGVVTSRCKYEIEVDSCLQQFVKYFKCIVTADDTTLHKPNPDPLLLAMDKLNAVPYETLYIGDTVFDRECAKNAGVKFALAVWGSNNSENINADFLFKKPADLLDILKM
ncbi:HAD family hydrolase [Ruminiclostridium cellulolyticum]|uniref:HAD-superfamily hydrolase, subfamily IA, variant 1 n=1 Tax=Ruminiclostridium cellulolyticum (strain ATCC 35319 / DSM 5812 / JCM 6584 / H10) TaxID=394503 RepID=B8I644_RUMCH|nr:HAD family hydrolase [Ruminiclostridium cellulolyticum]ACL76809.1 HAD-superfamily hydrolase, subfamily IA, variant 1 [Ruminiclostridium cellulolyticum H10]